MNNNNPSKNTMEKKKPIEVFMSSDNTKCEECGTEILKNDLVYLKNGSPYCMACQGFDNHIFLESGNAALTIRVTKYSNRSAVVKKYSKARKRYERQGTLVEADALNKAEEECLSDEDIREAHRAREAIKREKLDKDYIEKFAKKIVEFYPGYPVDEAQGIAEHACEKGSGRVGRTASAKDFDKDKIDLAVIAHIRHRYTDYDKLLEMYDKADARHLIKNTVEDKLASWRVKR